MKNISYFGHLIPKDFMKGLIMAGLAAAAQILYPVLYSGTFPMDLASYKHIGTMSIAAMGLYLNKNVFTNSQDKFGKPEPVIAITEPTKTETKPEAIMPPAVPQNQ